MKLKISKSFWQVIGLGTLAGMRATSAPAIASHILSRRPSKNLGYSPLRFMQSSTVATALKIFALGEIAGDKLPSAPNRTAPLGLAGRCLSGALAGASIYKANGGNAITGGLFGGAAACASTFGSFFLRKSTVKNTGLLDPIVGGIEDALVIGAGVSLTRFA